MTMGQLFKARPLVTLMSRGYCALPPVGQYKKLSEGTKEDFRLSQIHFAKHGSPEAIAKRLLGTIFVMYLHNLDLSN